jgi:hypothetical protein
MSAPNPPPPPAESEDERFARELQELRAHNRRICSKKTAWETRSSKPPQPKKTIDVEETN